MVDMFEGNLIFSLCQRVENSRERKLGPKTLPLDTWKEGEKCIMKESWIKRQKIYWQFRDFFFVTWRDLANDDDKKKGKEGKCHQRL